MNDDKKALRSGFNLPPPLSGKTPEEFEQERQQAVERGRHRPLLDLHELLDEPDPPM